MVLSWLTSYQSKQLYHYTLLTLLAFALVTAAGSYYFSDAINRYAIRITEETWGGKKLAPEYEKKIIVIAGKLNAPIPLIRKMNHVALQVFGYHNAFAYFPCILCAIPLGNQPFLYMSEGFFEDLSPQEQEFLIGHELIHIKERHTRYLNLTLWILFFCLLATAYFLIRLFKNTKHLWLPAAYRAIFIRSISVILVLSCIAIPELVESAYRKHIEKVADIASLQVLNSYDGFIQLMDRWKREFKMEEHNKWGGIFADHPSLSERKEYCLKRQNTLRDAV
jgi:Zn-dependent protease with chaperone function